MVMSETQIIDNKQYVNNWKVYSS